MGLARDYVAQGNGWISRRERLVLVRFGGADAAAGAEAAPLGGEDAAGG